MSTTTTTTTATATKTDIRIYEKSRWRVWGRGRERQRYRAIEEERTNKRTTYRKKAIKRRNYKYAENCKHTQTTSVSSGSSKECMRYEHETRANIKTHNKRCSTVAYLLMPLLSCWFSFLTYSRAIRSLTLFLTAHLSPVRSTHHSMSNVCVISCEWKKVSRQIVRQWSEEKRKEKKRIKPLDYLMVQIVPRSRNPF